jgi:uncharacterized protein (TIGR02300 family)
MGKATQKSSPASLGTKRSCPDCGTKFYDFDKDEVVCPKCATKIDKDDKAISRAAEPKKAKKEIPEEALMDSEDIVVNENSDDFESVEDLDDEEEDLVEDIESEEGDEDY